MRICPTARKSLAALLLLCLVVLVVPSPALAGGCDDPGSLGACHHTNSYGGHGGQPPIVKPVSHPAPAPLWKLDLAALRVWLFTLFLGR